MNDPYKILGVSPSASDDEIKAAYRELAKKYHPDNYANNPLGDLANEKMTEVNAAFDEIMNSRRGGSAYGSSSYGYSQGSSDYSQIRSLIQSGNVTEADNILSQISESYRNAEWYFLKGSIAYSRGWLNDAYNYFSRACSMDPNNREYSAALNQMNSQRGGYMNGSPSQHYNTSSNPGCSGCDLCQGLICADCCCECMGGDLISCC